MSDVTTGEFIKSKLMTDNINIMEPRNLPDLFPGLAGMMGRYTLTLNFFWLAYPEILSLLLRHLILITYLSL